MYRHIGTTSLARHLFKSAENNVVLPVTLCETSLRLAFKSHSNKTFIGINIYPKAHSLFCHVCFSYLILFFVSQSEAIFIISEWTYIYSIFFTAERVIIRTFTSFKLMSSKTVLGVYKTNFLIFL